jgi:hypothetical protein
MKKYLWILTLTDYEEENMTFSNVKDMIDFINDYIKDNLEDLYKPLTYYNFKNYYYNQSVELPYIKEIVNVDMKDYLYEDYVKYYPNKLEVSINTENKYYKKLVDNLINNEIKSMTTNTED